jgi:hypothetical protein
MAEELFMYADRTLRAHGVPYRRAAKAFRFEWVGDPAQHALIVRPALLALADRRLAGVRAEFEEALAKRPLGVPRDLENAVDEAAKSVRAPSPSCITSTASGCRLDSRSRRCSTRW